MGSKSSSQYCFDQPSRGLKLAVLWLLLTVLGVGYARRRGITLNLLPNTRSAQCTASDASARLLKYRDVSTTLSQKRVRARAHGTGALRMLDQVTKHERSAGNLELSRRCLPVVLLPCHCTVITQILIQGLLFAWSYNQPEARKFFALGLELDLKEPLLHWANAYVLGPFQNK